MTASDMAWSRAFAQQALSDLDAHDLLGVSGDKCHRLHFLQMAAEKLCKAFLISGDGYDKLPFKHCIISKYLPVIIRGSLANEFRTRASLKAHLIFIKHISPSCHANKSRPENSEYPWIESQDRVAVPCDYSFPNIDETDRRFVGLKKQMRTAASQYLP